MLISSVLGNKGVPGIKAAYAASKAGVSSLGESLRAEYPNGPIKVTVLEPGYIESEMTARSASTMLIVDNETGTKANGRRHRARIRPCRRAVVAVGAVGAALAGIAAAAHQTVCLDTL